VTFSRTEMCVTSNVCDWHAVVFEVGRTSDTYAVKCSNGHHQQYLLTYWQPVKHIMKNYLCIVYCRLNVNVSDTFVTVTAH